jgi:hypothetical protein
MTKFTPPTENEIARLHAEAKKNNDTLVVWHGFCAVVQATFLANALYEFKSRTRHVRRRILWHCERSIEAKFSLVKENRATDEDRKQLSNDIGIWLAYQLFAEKAARWRAGADGLYRIPSPDTKKEPPAETGG